MQASLLADAAVWRNVYVADSDAEAEDRLHAHLVAARAHIMHLRATLNPPDFEIDPAMLNAMSDPSVPDGEAVAQAMETGSIWGSPARVREQVAALADAGVGHLLCQVAFGAMERGGGACQHARLLRGGYPSGPEKGGRAYSAAAAGAFRSVEYLIETGASASKGLLRSSSFAISRIAGKTSVPIMRMQVIESSWLTVPSLPQSARMPGRVSSRMRRSFGTTVSGVPAMMRRSSICCSKLVWPRGLARRPAANSTKARRLRGEE